jgi:hypothetical protein
VQALLTRGVAQNHAQLASLVGPGNQGLVGLPAMMPGHAAGLAALNMEVTRQASLLAYINDFWVMMAVTVLAIPMLMLIPRPLRVRPALADQVRAQRLGNRRFATHPRMKVAGRQLGRLQRVDQHGARARFGAAAVHPVQGEFGLCLERQFVRLAVDFRQHHRARAGRQLGQAARDGGQGCVVADQQVPVELGRHDERAARAAHADHVAGLGLLCPLRGGAGVVQREVDLQRAGLGVMAARRVVAHGGAAAGGPHGAVGAGGRQRELAGGGVGKEDLRVVVEAGAAEAREVGARERDADQVRRHALGGSSP